MEAITSESSIFFGSAGREMYNMEFLAIAKKISLRKFSRESMNEYLKVFERRLGIMDKVEMSEESRGHMRAIASSGGHFCYKFHFLEFVPSKGLSVIETSKIKKLTEQFDDRLKIIS